MGNCPIYNVIAALNKEARPAQAQALTEATLRLAEHFAAIGERKTALALYTELLQPQAPTNIRRGAFAALLQLDKDDGEQRILDTLRGRDSALTPIAIARVASLKSAGASKTFAALLPGLSPSAQEWMIEALTNRGDSVGRSAIRAAVATTDAGVRRAAIAAVGKLEDATAVPLLAKALANAPSPGELQDIELALGSLRGGTATDRALVAQLSQSSANTKVRLFSVLSRRSASVAVPALLVEAGGSDRATVQAAVQALGQIITAADVPALLEILTKLKVADSRASAESAAARALAKIADVSQRSETVRAALAKSTTIEARCSLLRLLPNAADAHALAALKAAGGDQEPRIRDAAVRALGTWPDATGWNALQAVFQQPENDTQRRSPCGPWCVWRGI